MFTFAGNLLLLCYQCCM